MIEDLQGKLPLSEYLFRLRCKGGALYISITGDIHRRVKAYAKGTSSRSILDADEIPPELRDLSCIIYRKRRKLFYE